VAVEDLYEISYVGREAFKIHMPDKDLVFRERDHLYVASRGPEGKVYATVQENELLYTKEQVHRARQAYKFIRNCGYPLPLLMSEDPERTYRIYGQYPEYVKGKLVKKSVNKTPVDLSLCSIERSRNYMQM
jgi:hypothetical protein